MLAGQWWFRGAAIVVFLTAVFQRTQWKYDYPRAYRAVLAEAGHLCQTFCLTATWLGLAPFCTMAFADTRIEKALKVDGISESVLYAMGAGTLPAKKIAATQANPHRRRFWQSYFFETITEARVVSQSMLRFAPLPAFSKEMVKFSAGAGSAETFMSTRARSFDWPG